MRAGANLGNLLFTNAVWRQMAWTNAEQTFYFNPDYVNEHFHCVVIPAANWLYAGFDLTDLADRVEQLRIPAVMVGVGAQAEDGSKIPKVSASALRLVKAVSERSAFIGARGEFTADVLSHYGVKNVQVTGCPSLYFNTCAQQEIVKKDRLERVILAGTRYYLEAREKSDVERLQQHIFKLGFNERIDFLYQSERPELDYLIAGDESAIEETTMERALVYYGTDSTAELLSFLREHGKCYLDVDQWLASMCGYDLFVGTRIHGAIAALLAGTPALMISHDARTTELAEFAGIPSLPLSEVGSLTRKGIERIYEETSWDGHYKKMKTARRDYKTFLEANRLDHWILP